MARKLSGVVQPTCKFCLAGLVSLGAAAELLRAEGEIRVSTPSGVMANPFTKRSAQPDIVPDEPESSQRADGRWMRVLGRGKR